MAHPEDMLAARLEAARAMLRAITESVLSQEQREDLSVALGDIASEALHRVVHDGLTEDAATLLAHSIAELASVREMLAVESNPSSGQAAD